MIRDFLNKDKEQLLELVIESNQYQKSQLEKEPIDIENLRTITTENFEAVLRHEDQHYIVAETNGKLVGFILTEVSPVYKDRGSIDDLYIILEYRNKGIGKELMENALTWLKAKHVKKVGLSVHKSNETAIHLYKSFGFTEEPETYLSLEKQL